MKIPGNVVDQLVQGAQSDIRQVINMLSTWKLSNETMDFDQGKALYVEMYSPVPSNATHVVLLSEPR
jgi:replication factor C subunit 1